jgi:hypothetical protein
VFEYVAKGPVAVPVVLKSVDVSDTDVENDEPTVVEKSTVESFVAGKLPEAPPDATYLTGLSG